MRALLLQTAAAQLRAALPLTASSSSASSSSADSSADSSSASSSSAAVTGDLSGAKGMHFEIVAKVSSITGRQF
ncbi:MAG: hypothetical protein ACLUOI_16660 [Eisenbergiella sp.]